MKNLLLSIFLFSCFAAVGQNSFDRWVPISGTNTYTTNITSYPASYNNTKIYGQFTNGNTGNSTLQIPALSAVPIRKWDGDSWELLVSGDIDAGDYAELVFDNSNTYFRLTVVKSAGSGGGGTGDLDVGVSAVNGGTTTRVLYDNAGVLGEYVISGTGNVAMTTSPVFTTPNIGSATGSISGNAATVTTNANLTGPITSVGNATSIANDVALPGNPTTTTQSAGTNNTTIATTAYADAKVAEAITNGVTGIAPSEDQVFDALALKQSTTLAQNNHLIGNSSNVATAYPLFYVTPEQYGAVGDGSTDDATAINNAIASGLPVRFGNKNYRVNSTITTADETYLFGGGLDCIISTTSNIAIITIGGINGKVENLQLLGSGSGAAQRGISAVGNGSFNLYRYYTRVTDVLANDLGADGFYTINTIGNSSGSEHQGTFYMTACRATSCATGYLMDTRGEYNVFTNCLADNNTTGVRFNGGNNSWTGGNIVDNTTNVLIGSGTNDGHGVITGAKINHGGSNVTCASTATGFAFVGCEIVAGSITLTSCTDIRFYNCDIASSPITSTSAVGTIFFGNCFRTTPTITIAAGNNPSFVFNTFPAASTVHSLIVNNVQGGIQSIQQGPTSPNIFNGVWTTTASGQYNTQINGTITPRATTSDLTRGLIVDINHTQTANSQIFYATDLQPTATISAGGFTATENGALRTRGKIMMRALTTTGAVTGTDGFTYQKSNGDLIFEMSPDAVFRFGNAGSRWQFVSTSDGSTSNNNGNGALFSLGGIGMNVSVTNTGAGTTNSRGMSVRGGQTTSSGTTTWSAYRNDATHNQTGTASGPVYGVLDNPTITALLAQRYNFVSIGSSLGGVAQSSETSSLSTWDVVGSTGANITATATDITLDATHHTLVVDASGAARTITLPTASSCTRRIYVIINDTGTNTVTVDGNGGEDIGSPGGDTYVIPAVAGAGVTIQSNATKWLILSLM